jgi:hypothetical protein
MAGEPDIPEDDDVEDEAPEGYVCEPIPTHFYPFLEEKPFATCLVCQCELLEDGTQYTIQKTFNREEVVFEYAMCIECQAKLNDELSKESLEAINTFFSERVDFDERNQQYAEAGTTWEEWIASCVTCGIPRVETMRYSIMAYCDGLDLMYYNCPLMICEECEMHMQELFSKKTRDKLDGFVGTHFDCPSDFKEPVGTPMLV